MKRNSLRIWCLLLTLVMLLTMLPVSVFAGELDAVEDLINDTDPTVVMSKVNSKSEAKSWLNKNWWPSVKKDIVAELKKADVKQGSLSFHLEDFEAAVPKNVYDEDGTYGSAIVIVTMNGEELGYTTLLIKPDKWGKVPEKDYDDDDEVTYGKDELSVKINWEGDTSATRPSSVVVRLYKNNKLYRTCSLVGSKWYAGWRNIDNSKNWSVDVTVPAGYVCDIEEVENDRFEITMTKKGYSAPSTGTVVDKVNPETGAGHSVFCCR